MPLYPNSEAVCAVMMDLFQRLMTDPVALQELRRSGMVFRLDISNPPATMTVNGRTQRPQFVCRANGLRPDLVIHTPMDVLHQVWMNELKLGDAFFGGKIKVDGSMVRAFGLANLFRRIEAIYPTVVREHGLAGR